MSEGSSAPEIPQAYSSKKDLNYWRGAIKTKVHAGEEALRRFGGDPSLVPDAAKRHEAVEKLKLEQKLQIDTRTGLMNAEPFEELERRTIGLVDRDIDTPPVVEILMDIDSFGLFNKDFGIDAGNEALGRVGAAINSTIRDTDVAGRIGGEELKVLTSKTTSPDRKHDPNGIPLAERLRKNIEAVQLSTGRPVTVSLGVAEYERDEGLDDYKTRLNDALIVAKRKGKNKVVEAIKVNGENRFKDWSDGKIYKVAKNERGEILEVNEVTNG